MRNVLRLKQAFPLHARQQPSHSDIKPPRSNLRAKVALAATGLALACTTAVCASDEVDLTLEDDGEVREHSKKMRVNYPVEMRNPGRLDNLDGPAKEVAEVDVIKGLKVTASTALFEGTPKFMQVLGSLSLAAEGPESSSWYTQFILPSKKLRGTLIAVADSGQRVQARYMYGSGRNSFYVHAVTGPEAEQEQCAAVYEYQGGDFNVQAKLVNLAQMHVSYVQTVHNNVAIGVEGLHAFGQGSMVSYFGRYQDAYVDRDLEVPETVGQTATISIPQPGNYNLTYLRSMDSGVSLAGSYSLNTQNLESRGSVGARIRKDLFSFHGSVDTDLTVASQVKFRVPGGVVALSGELNHSTGESGFGIGYDVGGIEL